MSRESETWNRAVELMDRMHTAPTKEQREDARRERLEMLLGATHAMRQAG